MFDLRKINPWAITRSLRRHGIMGMNCRNIRYIGRYNPRALFPLVDNKLTTKQLALEHAVNVPDLITTIASLHDVPLVFDHLVGAKGFCIKPAQGSGGKGILVALASTEAASGWVRTDGRPIANDDIKRHLSNILAGIFSLGGRSDCAIVEELIEVDPVFKAFTFEGVPDLRVIVFKGMPVMAMMRLSCHESKGKANLHQGAVGVGIDIQTGMAINAVQHGRQVTHHPDTQQPLLDLTVPYWQDLLRLACKCSDMTGLGYLGVDLVLDREKGPLLLELNARPGLAIQVANDVGLLPRLEKISALSEIPSDMETRFELLKKLY